MSSYRVAFALVSALALLAGCDGAPQQSDETTFVPVPQQDALGEIADAAGYDINGIPLYDGNLKRWTINVKVPGCKSVVNLGGDPGPEAQSPTTFSVLAIAGTPLPQSLPHLKADELKRQEGRPQRLDCVS